jgi:hypothetical protein
MAKRASLYAVLTLIVLASLGAGGYWVVRSRSETVCGFCQRHINPRAGVIAEVGGRRRHVCCAHCAVTEGVQEHKAVHLITVTDYNTGRQLDPQQAWYVEGSRVVACTHDMARMTENKQVAQAEFDRCSPGTLAFANHVEADTFAAANGGVVLSLGEMLAVLNDAKGQP